ncbi:sensor histidine kinase [Angustibacter aerolatus]
MAEAVTSTSVRSLVLLRILTLYPVALAWQSRPPRADEVVLVLVLVASTTGLALRWGSVVPLLRRHVGLAAADVLVSLVVLAQAGTSSAFVAYTFTTAVLVGLLFTRGATVLLTTLLAAGYVLLADLERTTRGHAGWSSLTVPAAYVLLALAGSAFRSVHDRLAQAVEAAAAAERAAATAAERTRLARDLHDGLSSTLQGLVLQTMAVSRTAATGEADGVVRLTDDLEIAARAALAQSREVLTGLRRDDDSAPLVQAVADRSRRWSERTGVPVDVRTGGVGDLDPTQRIAALRVLDEALENVHRHAGASRVTVTLSGDDRVVELEVQDDGVGLGGEPAVRRGRFGVVGMTERAGVVGGHLVVEDARSAPEPDVIDLRDPLPRKGTRVRLTVPRGAAPTTVQGAR